ncbi:hypothetical protein AACH06_24755 [Ideonella sp. DXS29W]|uniref:HAF repeat-containing protein n=1 Tax=Ideonella lacteola TaxID=2984193 RepID=A0ABU9BVQ0_9BURK
MTRHLARAITLITSTMACAGAFAAHFHVTDLGAISDVGGAVFGINNQNVVVGQYFGLPAVFDHGTITSLPVAGGTTGSAYAINDLGVVTGYGEAADRSHVGLTWTAGVAAPLPTGGYSNMDGRSVNTAGHVVGTGWNAEGKQRAFVISGGSVTEVGAPPQGRSTFLYAVNEKDVAVGSFYVNGQVHAMRWKAGKSVDLGVGTTGEFTKSWANAVNNKGVAAGGAGTIAPEQAVVWDRQGTMKTLGLARASANGINDAGHVCGYALDTSAFYYDGKRSYIVDEHLDAASTGWRVYSAAAINKQNAMAATGRFGNDPTLHAVLVTVVD